MYTAVFKDEGRSCVIIHDKEIFLRLPVHYEATAKNIRAVVYTLNAQDTQDEKEALFTQVMQKLADIGVRMDFFSLRQWFMSKTPDMQREYRLGNVFGHGFKIRRNTDYFYFDQYPEDETPESEKWIRSANEWLRNQ